MDPDMFGTASMRDDSQAESMDALTTRHSASAPTLTTRDMSNAVLPDFELPINRELAPAFIGPEVEVEPGATASFFSQLAHQLMSEHVQQSSMSVEPMSSPPNVITSSNVFSSPVSAHGGAAAHVTAAGGDTQQHGEIDAATPLSTPPFNANQWSSASPLGYGAAPTFWAAQGDAVRFEPAVPRMSENGHHGPASGGGGARTEPCTPSLSWARPSPGMSANEQRLRKEQLRKQKKKVVDSVKPLRPLTSADLRTWVEEQDIAVTKKSIEDAIDSAALVQKERLRETLRNSLEVKSNSRESSVTRKKYECILFGYKSVLDLLVDLLYEKNRR